MTYKNKKNGEITSEIKSPSLQGILDYEKTIEERYVKHRMKHLQGMFKDIEIPRDKYVLLVLILNSLGCILSLMSDFAIFINLSAVKIYDCAFGIQQREHHAIAKGLFPVLV